MSHAELKENIDLVILVEAGGETKFEDVAEEDAKNFAKEEEVVEVLSETFVLMETNDVDPTLYCDGFNIPYGELDGTGCQIPIGHRDYCATCGPCEECYGMCVRDYQCKNGLVCLNGKCIDPAKI